MAKQQQSNILLFLKSTDGIICGAPECPDILFVQQGEMYLLLYSCDVAKRFQLCSLIFFPLACIIAIREVIKA